MQESEHPSDVESRRWRWAVLVAIAAILAVVLVVAVTLHVRRQQNDSSNVTGAAEHGATVKPDSGDSDSASALPDLPFTLSGVSYNAELVEVSEGADPAQLADSWTFGGDFSRIGSFPIDNTHVFGSTSPDSNNLNAYYAAILDRDGGAQALDTPSGPFYEPQDGTADGNRAVWRSATLSGNSAQLAYDNWRVQAWDAKTDTTVTLGTAIDINGRDDTPALGSDIVPTANQSTAFFASNIANGDHWTPSVLAFPLAGGSHTVIDEGNYPAAVADGVIYASDAQPTDDSTGFPAYATLKRSVGKQGAAAGAGDTVFEMKPSSDAVQSKAQSAGGNQGSGPWGIAGVWAHEGYRAVAFYNGNVESGTYIGFWADDFQRPLAWVHVKSPSVVASMNSEWFVWGSGSQSENTGMYAFNWSKGEITYLGACYGYSRPTIASDNNTVMVPSLPDNAQAVSFTVGTLR
ncbi:hypothetical protein [Bifidobacterium oedipodis]|uniref:Uncharacterized protein n=1 Tax=Bifidobacterium oedipodis TaxID=2675322 RepID=A0A7Y0ERG1_9BIFI|nr:hypothetical protein [Bifidobacterium sp. DSM 109957]NMM95078.1 hypothetical protein [Bifidobacterium sp. DSM 109957]